MDTGPGGFLGSPCGLGSDCHPLARTKEPPLSPTAPSPATFHGRRVDQQCIAGAWRDGASGETRPDVNPYDDSVVAQIALATEADLD